MFTDGSAVVNVGDLSADEKRQILYNHIALGDQPKSWKRAVKPHLEAVSQVRNFLPGIAERLGHPAFTKDLPLTLFSLKRFMEEPKEHLIATINALDASLRAALILVYVHRGAMSSAAPDPSATEIVATAMGVSSARIHDSLDQLQGSFLNRGPGGQREVWKFAHPTIADALTDILTQPAMLAVLLRGAPIETILGSLVCEGADAITDALTVPPSLNDALVARLRFVPDEPSLNQLLFWFLANRASDEVFSRVVTPDPAILRRYSWRYGPVSSNAQFLALARAHKLHHLDDTLRLQAAERIETAISQFDLSCFENEELLGLIPPIQLVSIGTQLFGSILEAALERIAEIADEAEPDDDPETLFEDFTRGLEILESLPDLTDRSTQLLRKVREAVTRATLKVQDKSIDSDDDADTSVSWRAISAASQPAQLDPATPRSGTPRSVFDDVDEH